MASPVADSYTCASGGSIYGGRVGAAPPATFALLGDSISSTTYNISPRYWSNALNGGVLAPIINAGVSGDTVANVLARIDNAYTNASPGLASAPEALGWVFCQIGTNNARAGAINSTIQGQIDTLVTKCLTHGEKLVFFSIPPLGGAEAAANANVPGYNSYFAGKANGSTVFYIDSTANLYTGANQNGAYFTDGIHYNSLGVMRVGVDEGPLLAAILASYNYPSPVDDAATSSTTQWHPNPRNAGTGGTIGSGHSGQLPNSYSIANYGAGGASTCAVVAADVGDANQTPYASISPTALGVSGNAIRISLTAAGRTVTDVDPGPLDVVVEVRFVGFDASRFTNLKTWMHGASGRLLYGNGGSGGHLTLHLGLSTTLDEVAVLRVKLKRATAQAEGAQTIYIDLTSAGAYSGSMGSVQIRCHTIKG